ncbi:hypothetical protein [Desulfosporosinus fructosivorans]
MHKVGTCVILGLSGRDYYEGGKTLDCSFINVSGIQVDRLIIVQQCEGG